MKRCWVVLLILLVLSGVGSAQETVITPDTPVNSGLLRQWLHSGDPRLIAWAADFAGRTHDAGVIGEMPALLEHWTMPPMNGDSAQAAAERRAVLAVLDTLIQQNASVPVSAIKAVAERFPTQAAILIGRVPLDEARSTLDGWTYGYATTRTGGGMLARVASMILAKDPKGDFVAGVVAASEEDLKIVVSSGESRQVIRIVGPCADAFGHTASPGWPQVYTYMPVENDSRAKGPLVVDLDGDRITTMRLEENSGWGSCYGVQALTPATRHRLIAHWLGVSDGNVPWNVSQSVTVTWSNEAAYEKQVGAIVAEERRKFRETAERLRELGLLHGQGEVDKAMPRLEVTIACDLKPCPLK